MATPLPPLKPLRAFEATARAGSVTAAAEELNVTHSAISHQIKALEKSLGMKLFERQAAGLKLTAEGNLLLPAVTVAFKEIASAAARMSRPTTSGKLSIACPPALLSFWLMPRINQFSDQYPNIQLQFTSSVDKSLLFTPNVDVAILYGDAPRRDCWLSHWAQFDLFPVTSPTHLNRHSMRDVSDLSDHVLLHADDGREWQTWFGTAGALDIKPRQEHYMGDARLALDAALQGQGIALGDTLTASNLLGTGDLVVPFDLAVPANDAFYIACKHEIRSTPIVDVFIEWLFRTLSEDQSKLPVPNSEKTGLVRKRKRKS
ncbi:LysR substrate-binding domain-containing protein [Sneathiella glossodoripedis]|uniref:LysR substrate-binding domain-containing protein n=1 Tax=Sneathiella glossodoripedis TaxID=418853 RepID=UPI000471E5A7|nr:LysR substrate-binding domain-containing protein [Sneathiella glossodoripedis]